MSLYSLPAAVVLDTKNYEYHGALSLRQRHYRAQRVSQLLEDTSEETKMILLEYWLSKLESNTLIVSILDGIGLEIPAKLAPKSVAVNKLCQNFVCYVYVMMQSITVSKKTRHKVCDRSCKTS